MADYSLWLVPSSPESETTTKIIHELIEAEPDSPAFEPHITLLHPVDISTPIESITTTLQNIAQSLDLRAKPLWLNLKPAQRGTFYYQSVLAPVEANETLTALRSACEDAFEWKGDKPYFPHLSLLYGDISTERREELAKTVQDGQSLPGMVTIEEILVVDCTGTTKDWKTVASVPLL